MTGSDQTSGSGSWLAGVPDPVAAGTPGLFDRFVREQYQGLLQFLRSRTVNPQDAEDAAQESLVRLLRYRASTPFAEWRRLLYRIAINAAHDQFREARHFHADAQVAIEDCDVRSPVESPEIFASHRQTLAHVRRTILHLPPKCRRVCLLRLVRGLTNAEIAQHCGISVKMVEKHLTKGLAVLRSRVGDSGQETL